MSIRNNPESAFWSAVITRKTASDPGVVRTEKNAASQTPLNVKMNP